MTDIQVTSGISWIENALGEIGETNATRTDALVRFRELLFEKLQNELPLKARLDDEYIIRFIRYSKYDIARAVKCFINFYKLWNSYPGKIWPVGRGPTDWQVFFAKQMTTALQPKNNDRSTVLVCRKGAWNPGKDGVECADCLAPLFYTLEMLLEDVAVQVAGYTIIIDGAGFGWSCLPYFDLKTMKVCQISS